MENLEDKGARVDKRSEEDNQLVINYRLHRKLLGILGIFLPVGLLLGSIIWDGGHIETAISNYFHTPLRDLFVVTLAAISLFLFTYTGYDQKDKWITNIAGFFGILTAFVNTNYKPGGVVPEYIVAAKDDVLLQSIPYDSLSNLPLHIIPAPITDLQKYFHLACAALFFITLAYMCFFQFGQSETPSRRKLYKGCAIVMAVTILALFPYFLNLGSTQDFYNDYKLIFVGEAICMWAFGLAWLVKGIPVKEDEVKEKAKQQDLADQKKREAEASTE